ncbi:MAG: hypothetical protein ACI35S_01085 [Anaeroplasma sp.]
MPSYVVYRPPTMGEILARIIVSLLIVGIILYIIFWIGMIVLFIVLGIAGAIGFFWALYIYIRATINAVRSTTFSHNNLREIFLSWFVLFKNISTEAFKDNLNNSRRAYANSRNHRFISPKRWLWNFVTVFLFVIVTAMIILIDLFQLFLICSIVILTWLFIAFVFACTSFVTIILGVAMIGIKLVKNILYYDLYKKISFSLSTELVDYAPNLLEYLVSYKDIITSTWNDMINYLRSFSISSNFLTMVLKIAYIFAFFIAFVIDIIIYTIIAFISFIILAFVNILYLLIKKIFIH